MEQSHDLMIPTTHKYNTRLNVKNRNNITKPNDNDDHDDDHDDDHGDDHEDDHDKFDKIKYNELLLKLFPSAYMKLKVANVRKLAKNKTKMYKKNAEVLSDSEGDSEGDSDKVFVNSKKNLLII